MTEVDVAVAAAEPRLDAALEGFVARLLDAQHVGARRRDGEREAGRIEKVGAGFRHGAREGVGHGGAVGPHHGHAGIDDAVARESVDDMAAHITALRPGGKREKQAGQSQQDGEQAPQRGAGCVCIHKLYNLYQIVALPPCATQAGSRQTEHNAFSAKLQIFFI